MLNSSLLELNIVAFDEPKDSEMRGPLEIMGDAYDYQYQYFRYYVFRRLIFSETTTEDVKKTLKFNIFRNNDSENVGELVSKTTFLGLSAGFIYLFY